MRQLNVKYGPWRHHPLPFLPLRLLRRSPPLRDLISGALNVQFVLKQTPIATFKKLGASFYWSWFAFHF